MTQSNGRGRFWPWAPLLATLSVAAPIGAGPPEAWAQGRADVAIVDFAYQPESILVQAGDTVIWTNTGETQHTVTADVGAFDSGPLAAGAGFRQLFPTAGLFTYHCAIHPQMIGAITVTQAPDQGGSNQVNQVPRTGVGRTLHREPLPMALLAMIATTVLAAGAVLGHRRPGGAGR